MTKANGTLALRACPTLSEGGRPLIAQLIPVDLCFARQRQFYHKCHRCQFRGRPAEEVTPLASTPPSRNGQAREAQAEGGHPARSVEARPV